MLLLVSTGIAILVFAAQFYLFRVPTEVAALSTPQVKPRHAIAGDTIRLTGCSCTFLISLTFLAVPFLFAQSILALALALFFNGVAVAPLIINAYSVAETSLPRDQITQALSWVVAGMPVGGALASAVSGWSIDRYGAQISFWVPLGFLIAALLATLPYFTTYQALISYSSKHD